MVDERHSDVPADGEDCYRVGYKCPPKTHQFQKGQSGNPRGRKKISKDFETLVKAQFSQKMNINVRGKARAVTFAQALLMAISKRALEGDRAATAQLIALMQRYCPAVKEDEDYDLRLLSDEEFFDLERLLTKASSVSNKKF